MRARSCLAANMSATEMFENALDLNCCMAIALATVSGMLELILSDLKSGKKKIIIFGFSFFFITNAILVPKQSGLGNNADWSNPDSKK